ncbi:MAG: hypothetical protein AAFP00_10565 [Bacteroidota bacterium]
MNSREIEYLTLRRELVHYDAACLTILGSLITASAAIYGVVSDPERHPYGLLCGLDVIWLIGFMYIVDKRSSIIRIALYIKMRFEGSNSIREGEELCYYEWETWLDSSGRILNGRESGLCEDSCTDSLPIVDPTWIEFVLLVFVCLVDTAWLVFVGYQSSWELSLVLLSFLSLFLLLVSIVIGFSQLKRYLGFREMKKTFPESLKKKVEDN